jgi:hypothetical protein
LALAWSEHAFEIACLSVALAPGVVAVGGVCADALPVATKVNDRIVAQIVIALIIGIASL